MVKKSYVLFNKIKLEMAEIFMMKSAKAKFKLVTEIETET